MLGTLAILIIGGLAVYLANRKTGDTITSQTTITTSEENNTSVTRHIPPGLTVQSLEAIGDILTYEGGFIGISKDTIG